MCGRMTLTRSGDEIAAYFALASLEKVEKGTQDGPGRVAEIDGAPWRVRYNVAPSQEVPTILCDHEGLRVSAWKQWGLVPSWSQDPAIGGGLFNARSETAHEKPSFRASWKKRRCLVIADGFYEWTPRNRDHQPYYFRPMAGDFLAFAGLFEEWHGEGGEVIESCTVLTTAANADLEGIHHRMPVILDRSRFDEWLQPGSDPALLTSLQSMMAPSPIGTLAKSAVSRRVNNARIDDAACLDPPSDEYEAGAIRAESTPTAHQGELFGRSAGDEE